MTEPVRNTYFEAARSQVPVLLSGPTVVEIEHGSVFWVENFRGYDEGFTFTTNLIVAEELHQSLGLEVGPDMSGFHDPEFDPEAQFIETWVSLDSRRLESSAGTLELINAEGAPRLVSATWWVPMPLPGSLTVGFRWPAAALSGQAEIETQSWREKLSHLTRL